MNNVKTSRTTQPLEWATAMDLLNRLETDQLKRERLLFALGFFTGLLVSDYRVLRWSDLVFSNGSVKSKITLLEEKTKDIKVVGLNKKLQEIICDLYNGEDLNQFIFISKRHSFLNKPLTVGGCNYLIKKILKRYNIKTANYTSHTLRKTFGKRVWEVKGKTDESLVYLSQIFNHPNISITKKYLAIQQESFANLYLSI